MSTVSFGVNNPLTNQAWEKKLDVEVIEATYFRRFLGEDTQSMLQLKDELQKGAGDRVTCGLRGVLTGDGKQGNEVLEGDEEAFTTASDTLFLDEMRHATSVPGGRTIDAQRVPYNLREEGYDALKQWVVDRLDTSMMNQLCGFTPETRTVYTGLQAVPPTSVNNIIRANNRANDAALVAGDEMTLRLVDSLRERASTMRDRFGQPLIRPFMINGSPYYILFVHDYQETDLRRDAGDGGWYQIQRDALSGGAISDSPIFTGALGCYNNVILHKATRVTQGISVDGTVAVPNTRRAVFCGAQAGWVTFGQGFSTSAFRWVERLTDYQKALGIAVAMVWGMKRSQYRNADFGTIVLSTFAQPHDGIVT